MQLGELPAGRGPPLTGGPPKSVTGETRRAVLRGLGATVGAAVVPRVAVGRPGPAVAVTIDDFDIHPEATTPLSLDERSAALLAALRSRNLEAATFVCGMRVDNDASRRRLRAWNDAGHLIANHSYAHPFYPSTPFEVFTADVLKCEALLRGYPRFVRRFRHPFLKEGETPEQRDRLRAFLREHGYRSGAVTIDASDWAIDDRLRSRLARDPSADLAPYRDFYLAHVADRSAFYRSLADRALGQPIRHTLLLHHNLLNALFLGDLLAMLVGQGWRLVDATYAYEDPVFERTPDISPSGESLVWAIAKETGRFEDELRYPAEDGRYEAPRMDALGL